MYNCMINLQHMQTNCENGAQVYLFSAHDGALQVRIVRMLEKQSIILQRNNQNIIPVSLTLKEAANAVLSQEHTRVESAEQGQSQSI
jgi:hypothetical protein